MADTKLTALTQVSVPDPLDQLYGVDVSDTTDSAQGSSRSYLLDRVLGLLNNTCQGRITPRTLTPVPTVDTTTATTIYYTPYLGNVISLFDGTRWVLYQFSELSLALGSITTAKNYDLFGYVAAGALAIDIGPAWSSDVLRGTGAGTTELVLQNSVYVNKVAVTGGINGATIAATAGRYLGSFRTTASGTTSDREGTATQAGAQRLIWNYYNRVRRHVMIIDTTNSWTYNTGSYRISNGASTNYIEVLSGLPEAFIDIRAHGFATGTTAVSLKVGIGKDSNVTSNDADVYLPAYISSANVGAWGSASIATIVPLGYHKYNWLEKSGATTTTFYGSNGGADQTGLTGWYES